MLQACNGPMGGANGNPWTYNASTKKCVEHGGGNTGTSNQFKSLSLCAMACETPIPVRPSVTYS